MHGTRTTDRQHAAPDDDRVRDHTAPDVLNRLDQAMVERARDLASGAATPEGRTAITQRVDALEREWDIERVLELNAGSLALFGTLEAIRRGRSYAGLTSWVASREQVVGCQPAIGASRTGTAGIGRRRTESASGRPRLSVAVGFLMERGDERVLLVGLDRFSQYAARTLATASPGGVPVSTARHARAVPVRPCPPRQPTSTCSPRRERSSMLVCVRPCCGVARPG